MFNTRRVLGRGSACVGGCIYVRCYESNKQIDGSRGELSDIRIK